MRRGTVFFLLILVLIFLQCRQENRESYDPVVTDTGLLIMSQQYPYRISSPSYIDNSDRYYYPEDLLPDYLYGKHHNRYYNEYTIQARREGARYDYSDYRYRDYRYGPYRSKQHRRRYHRYSHQRYYDHEDAVSETYDSIPLPEVKE